MYKWFLNDGTYLTGKDAEQYLVEKLNSLKQLSVKVGRVISECESLNKIEEDESLAWSVMETEERLSIIQIQLELLLKDMNVNL